MIKDKLRSLLRTNIKLTGNTKLALHTDVLSKGNNSMPAELCISDNVYLEPIESILPTYNIKANLYSGSYEFDIKNFYTYYKDFFYNLNDDTQQNKNNQYYISQNINDNRKSNFEFGCKRISYEKNNYQFAFLAPLYITSPEQFPDKFVIKLKYTNNNQKNIEKTIHINLNSGQLWHNYISNYIKQINDKVIKLDINNFNSYYFGIDVLHGGFIKAKDNISKTLFDNELTITEFDNIITNSFMKNNMVISQILNLSYYFNIDDSVFSDISFIEDPFDFLASFNVSGYYEKNGEKVPFYDIDFNYEEEYINKYTSNEELFYNEDTNKNVFDLLGENTFIDFKYLCKQIPQINKWSLLVDEDYRLNLSEAYSTENGLYGNSLPFNNILPSFIKTGENEIRYSFDWFEMPINYPYNKLPKTVFQQDNLFNEYLLSFSKRETLATVKQNTVLYRGYQYTFEENTNYNNYKFGIILLPAQTYINTNFFLKYDNNIIELENDGQKYIFYTILLNIPLISDSNNTLTITPKILNDIYYSGMSDDLNTNLFNIITPYNSLENYISIDKINYIDRYFSISSDKGMSFYDIKKKYGGIDDEEKDTYLKYLGKYYEPNIVENFKNIIFLSLSNNIGNNLLYIDYQNIPTGINYENSCNNIYYLNTTVAKKIQELYLSNNILNYNDKQINEAVCLKRLLGLEWVRRIENMFDAEHPEYIFKTYEDVLINQINNLQQSTDENDINFVNYLYILLNDVNIPNLKINWLFIKNNILFNGLLLDNITKDISLDINSNELVSKTYYTILINKNNEAIHLDYNVIKENLTYKNILYTTNLGDNLLVSSNSPIWENTTSYKISNIIYKNGSLYMVDINIKSIPKSIQNIILNLLPNYNVFKTYQKPYFIELQKRLLKVPITIINKSNIKETNINIFKNSIAKIKMYRYMGFIVPKMRKILEEGGYTDLKENINIPGTFFIKNYFQKKIKSVPNTLLSYTAQTDYLPVYESINEYTLYQNEIELKFSNNVLSENSNLQTKIIKGIDINKYNGIRLYDSFNNYTYIKQSEYKYFNASKIYLLPVIIKIDKNVLNLNLNNKQILINYINEKYNFLKLSNDDINYIVNLYTFKEKKEYEKYSSKLITKIIYTLK